MQLVLIEDEEPALAHLERLVHRHDPSIRIVERLRSAEDALQWFRQHPCPDLVLSDIRLSDGSALDVFAGLNLPCPIVFCTAYDEYVLEAFKHNAVDYLLKPIEAAALADALRRHERLARHIGSNLAAAYQQLVRPHPAFRERFVVRRGVEFVSMPVERIAYFTSEHKLVVLVDRLGQQALLDGSLNDLQAELDPAVFFRVNRRFLVHIEAVQRFRSLGKGRLALTLEPAAAVPVIVSQETARAFRQWLDR